MNGNINLVRIDLEALAHNLGEVRRLVGPTVKIMAVVKADAYGHGLVRAGLHFARHGADALGVMNLHEALRLREAGAALPVFILAGFEPGHCRDIVEKKLIPFVYDLETARELNKAAALKGVKTRVHLKIDSGMNRLGQSRRGLGEFFLSIKALTNLEPTGLCTHLAEADSGSGDFTDRQAGRFEKAAALAVQMGLPARNNNCANSAAVVAHPGAYYQMVRPGLMLYGDNPCDHLPDRVVLRPAMSMTSRIIQVKTVPAGEGVGYGRTFTAAGETVLAVAPVGYAHGYSRRFSNKGYALIRGRRASIRGRVCMNLTMFDVTDIPGAAVGDEVVLLGSQGQEKITGRDLADIAETITYEIFCHLGGLNAREHQG
ncbi:MAG: alanine racemase [Pseudomonadota bacterium]